MAQRKDMRGRALHKGESQRKEDGRYIYTYRDPIGNRHFIYSMDLAELRRKEKELMRDQLDGIDSYTSGTATINYVFDRYMSVKKNLRKTTRINYEYMYNRFIRDSFGLRKIGDIRFSDVFRFYNGLLESGLQVNTLDTVHTLLHPTFQLAVRDQIIRINPTDGVMAEVKKASGQNTGVRHALTLPQQRAFMEYIAGHPVYGHWWPLFTVLLGTGCRIGEAVGLRWEDIDFEKGVISINHSLVYYPTEGRHTSAFHVSLPKTEAGIRTIPLLDSVRQAFEIIREEREGFGWDGEDVVIDGMSGFVFYNRYGSVPNPQSVNRAIKRIVADYNAAEELEASRQRRKPLLLPEFSAHSLRHTFCTRLCENETNLKVIQSVMGHRDIQTTLDIYAEATEEKKQESFERLGAMMDVF